MLIPEAMRHCRWSDPAIVSLIGYSAMVGAVGGGGRRPGIRYGYQRFMPEVMALVVLVLIVLVSGTPPAIVGAPREQRLRDAWQKALI